MPDLPVTSTMPPRRHTPSPTALGLAVVLAALPAAARAQREHRPPTVPTRDVAVVYRAADGHEGILSWRAAEQRVRGDFFGSLHTTMIADLRRQTMVLVRHAERTVTEVPLGPFLGRLALIPGEARLAREEGAGVERVAGHPCHVWRVEQGGRHSVACLTADGVLLRLRTLDGPRTVVEAVAVAYGQQDPARFRPPPGYQAGNAAAPRAP